MPAARRHPQNFDCQHRDVNLARRDLDLFVLDTARAN